LPATAFAATSTTVASTTTTDNVNTILKLEDLMISNNLRDGDGESYATGKFTWDTLNQAIENIATPVTPRDVLADTEPTLSEVSTEEKTESVATETAVEEKTPEASAVSVENTTHRRIKMLGRCERFERPLRVGCVGADVEKMKKALCEKGILANNASNGDIFGIATRRAVEILQRESGLNPTGRVDEETWTEIFR